MISLKSKVTNKILNYFFMNPNAKHYVNELARILDLDSKNVHTKLLELGKAGLLLSEFSGKQRYFSLAKKFPLLKDYRSLILKTTGVEQQLKDLLNKVLGVKEAYLFGSYASNKMDESSDIDLMVIGDCSLIELQRGLNRIQKSIGREINVINLSKTEFDQKKKKDQFIKNIISHKKIKLL